jgi:hypothetical protein
VSVSTETTGTEASLVQVTDIVMALSRQLVRMPLPETPGAPFFDSINVTKFLELYEILFTACHWDAITAVQWLPFYCLGTVADTIRLFQGYIDRDWALLKRELLEEYRSQDSWQQIHTIAFLQQLAHRQALQTSEDYASIRSYTRTFSAISANLVQRGVFTEYGQIRLFLSGLQFELVKHLVIEFGLDMHRSETFQGKFVDISKV